MDSDIVQRMRAEEADLARKLAAVRGFLAAYGEEPLEVTTPPLAGAFASPVVHAQKREYGARPKVEIDKFTEQSRISVLLSMMAMTTANRLMKTKQLVDFVEHMGFEVSGDNKINALGALLSRSVDIISHGKSGWELADREKALGLIEQNRDLIGGAKENAPPASLEAMLGGADTGSESVGALTDRTSNPFS